MTPNPANVQDNTVTEQTSVAQAPAEGPGTPEPTNAVDALRAEVAAEQTENPDGYTTVPLGEATVRVKSVLDWRSSAQAALRAGDFETWAELCLHPDDYEQVWVEVDPTLREINDMFAAWGQVTGQGSAGKASSFSRSLRRTLRS